MGLDEMAGAGNFVMVADPATFRVLPWAQQHRLDAVRHLFPERQAGAVLDAGALSRCAGEACRRRASIFSPASKSNSNCSSCVDPKLAPDSLTWPAEAPAVEHTTHGFQYLTESRFDQVDPILRRLAQDRCRRSACRCVSLEVELGPSQYEFTFAPERGLAAADTMVLFRSAMKQVARRHGHLVSFMCRPRLPNTFASGWHLHQSLLDRKSGKNLFVSSDKTELLSPLGRHYLAGLLAHARAAAAFTTPTVNGYKRYHGVNSMAPIQAIWAKDNRGVMVRVLGEPGDPSTHLENRVGEPLANPYLYMASQIHAGLDGIARKLKPGPSADSPYEISRRAVAEVARRGAGRAARTAPVSARASATSSSIIYLAHQARRDRALRRRDRAGRPAMRPKSPPGSTRSISIWPDEGASNFAVLPELLKRALRLENRLRKLCHFEPILWRNRFRYIYG